MFDLLQIAVAVGATQLASEPLKALVTEGTNWSATKIKEALENASKQSETAAAIRRAEAFLQTRPTTSVRALLDAIDPSKCQSVYQAVRDLEQDADGTNFRARLLETFTLCSPQGTSPSTITEAVDAFYVSVLEALYVSKSPLRPHAELLHHNWQHAQTLAALATSKNSERARDTIAKIKRYKEAGQTSAAEALVRELEGDESLSSDGTMRAELLTLSADLLENRGRLADAASKLLEAKRLAPDSDVTRTNEFRAHELLGQFPQAARIAQGLRERHPYCVKCCVAYLRTAPTEHWRAEVDNLPTELLLDWRVPTTIAARAAAEHDGALALEYARKAIALKTDQYQPWYLVSQAIAVLHDTTTLHQPSAAALTLLEEGLDACDRCITLLQSREQTSSFEAKALALKSGLLAALGRKVNAAAASERAYHLASHEPDALVQYARTLEERGEQSTAIELLSKGRTAGSYDIDLPLAQLLLRRGQPGDAAQAQALLLPIALQATPLFQPHAVGLLFTAASRDEGGDADRIEQLAERLKGACVPAWINILRAAHMLRQGAEADAAELASKELPTADLLPLPYRRNLASILTDTRHLAEALPLWQGVARDSVEPADIRNLLFVALKLERHDVALEILESLQAKGSFEIDLFSVALDLLERYKPLTAADVLRNHLVSHPKDRVARLRLSILGVRLDQPDLVDADLNAIPEVAVATPQQARAAVHLLRYAQKHGDAIKYAYRVLRLNFSYADAHAAYRDSVMLNNESRSLLDAPAAVQLGSAVQYRTETGELKWLVIEEEDAPDTRLDEIGPGNALCERLLGVKTEEQFLLRDTFGIEQHATVVEIKSKYLFRFHDVLNNTQDRFPSERGFTSVPFKLKEDGEIDVDHFLRILPRNTALAEVEAEYVRKPIPLQLFVMAGKSDRFDALLYLMDHGGLGPRCCAGTPEELANAEAALKVATRTVIDTTALVTAFLSENWSLLDTDTEFLVTTGTLELIRSKGPRAFGIFPRSHVIVDGPPWTRNPREVGMRLDEFLEIVKGKAVIADAEALARLDPVRRNQLTEYFGLDCAEAIALAAELQAVFWTDDLAAGIYAEQVFGVGRVWTQSIARFGRVRGQQRDPEALGSLTASLLGWRYAFTATSRLAWHLAGRTAMWNADHWPLRGAILALSSPEISDEYAVPIAAELVTKGCLELSFPPARQVFVSSIVDAVGRRHKGFALVRRMLQHLQTGFGLHVSAAEDAKEVVRSWLATTTKRAMSGTPSIVSS